LAEITRRASRTDRIVEQLTARLNAGAWRVGERLLSVRRAAAENGVSKNTMAEAYDRLVARGLLEARVGSGYYVAQGARVVPPAVPSHVSEAVDLVTLLREQLDQHYEVRPGDGRLPPSWMEGSELRRSFLPRRGAGADAVEFGYGSSHGYAPLRERIRGMLLERSIDVRSGGVLLTHGANHALDLIIRQYVAPGDVVFVDEPGYYPLFAKLALAKAHIVGIRRGPAGPDLDDLAAALTIHRPKLFFTQSQAHNPTGGTLTPAIAFGLLQAAERAGFRIVEDDVFADILPSTATRLAALDGLQRVLYVGAFSKTLSASLRCGYVAADPETTAALCDLKMVTTVATSDFVERFVFGLIQGGHYLRHLRRLRSRLEEARRQSVSALERLGLRVEARSETGFYLWAELPRHVDELDLCRAAAARSIFLAPGDVFHPTRSADRPPALRINVAYGADPRFHDFLRTALSGPAPERSNLP
jgi:DNA-binding transcriptional MocR family regulator